MSDRKVTDYALVSYSSIKDFVNAVAEALTIKLTWHGEGLHEVAKDSSGRIVLKINPKYYRPQDVKYALGDSSKARKVLKWKPKVSFYELAKIMAHADLNELKQHSKNL